MRTPDGKPVGSATVLDRIDNEVVARLCKRLKEEMKPRLDYCAADELEVQTSDGHKLEEDALVPDAPSKQLALIVIAPQQPAASTSGGASPDTVTSE